MSEALEALEWLCDKASDIADGYDVFEREGIVRAALEQPSTEPGEAVARVTLEATSEDAVLQSVTFTKHGIDLPEGTLLYTAPPSTAEPVAWCWEHLGMHVTTDRERARQMIADGVDLQPLYAAPPSTAEAQTNALEGFAKKMRRHAKEADLSPAERRVRRRAAQFADAEAKRIREKR